MAPLPRRVSFVVGTSLLGAALSLGCTSSAPPKKDTPKEEEPPPDTVNVGPQDEEPKRSNTGPWAEPPQPEPPPPEPIHVNEGPKPPPEQLKVNPGPTEEKPEPVEEKRVNTRPNDL